MSVVRRAPGVAWRFTDLGDGDFRVPPVDARADDLRAHQSVLAAQIVGPDRRSAPVTWLRQHHGTTVVVVGHPGEHAGAPADAAVTACPGAVLSVITADCAPVVLHGGGTAGDPAVLGVVHAGWRGLLDGVLEAAVDALRRLAGNPRLAVAAALGPCIGPECYEFGAADLALLVERHGRGAAALSAAGTPALDVATVVRSALGSRGVEVDLQDAACTACHPDRWFSHRRSGDGGRQALVAWMEPAWTS